MGELVHLPKEKDWLPDNKEVDIVTEKAVEEEDRIRRSTESVLSNATTLGPLEDDPWPSFHPSHVFRLDAQGIGLLRLPLPPRQLEISIYGADGSPAYVSRRSKRCSGDCVLSHPQLGDLLSTTFYFGPNRNPVIRFLQSSDGYHNNDKKHPDATSVAVSGKWSTRTTNFTTPEGRTFEWSYAKRRDSNGRRVNLIILRRKQDDGNGQILAQLVRSDETRTAGSARSTAGNGGVLLVDQGAWKLLDEALIVATCLIMLKKEIDRRRAVQMAVIAGVAAL